MQRVRRDGIRQVQRSSLGDRGGRLPAHDSNARGSYRLGQG